MSIQNVTNKDRLEQLIRSFRSIKSRMHDEIMELCQIVLNDAASVELLKAHDKIDKAFLNMQCALLYMKQENENFK